MLTVVDVFKANSSTEGKKTVCMTLNTTDLCG